MLLSRVPPKPVATTGVQVVSCRYQIFILPRVNTVSTKHKRSETKLRDIYYHSRCRTITNVNNIDNINQLVQNNF